MDRFGLITQLFFRGENNKQEDVVLWNVTPCTLLDVCKCFEETVCLRLDAVYTKYGGSILFQNIFRTAKIHCITLRKTIIFTSGLLTACYTDV